MKARRVRIVPFAYYNDNNAYCCQWLRNLTKAGHLPSGRIDERPIQEVQTSDLEKFRQVHFFAGIGGWAYALQLAGWPKEAQVWTGSCPCQPYSAAGQGRGDEDPRNLWPQFRRLISEYHPSVVFGEQVASKAGRNWLTGVRTDLEEMGYAVGASDLCAAGVGAPHIRQRLWWVADSSSTRHTRSMEDQRRVCVNSKDSSWNVWDNFKRVTCSDWRARRFKPGAFPLAYGLPTKLGQEESRPEGMELLAETLNTAKKNRIGRIGGYGNAIVPQVAVIFIRAFMSMKNEG